MATPQSFPNRLINTQDARTPDANPIVGGPYLQGYNPVTVASQTNYTGGAYNSGQQGQVDSSRSQWLALPVLKNVAVNGSFTPSGNVLTEASQGDQPYAPYNLITEDRSY